MQVQMIHRLPAILAGVNHDAVALGESFGAGKIRSDAEQVPQQCRMLFARRSERPQVLARDNQ
jgi:hypothetical protein